MRAVILLMVAVSLSGCASIKDRFASMSAQTNPDSSYVFKEISGADSELVAKVVTVFLSSQLPAAKTILGMNSSNTAFDSMLRDMLAQRGFGVSQSGAPGSVPVRYLVTVFQNGILVRLRYQDKEISQLYDRTDSGSLSLHARFAIREVRK
ncbi:MAG: hypothetical protein ABI216_21890 [Devosia sp.]